MPLLHDLIGEVPAVRAELEAQRRQKRAMEWQMGSQLLSRSEAAERIGCSEKTIIRREQDGILTPIEVPGVGIRYPISEVDALKGAP